MSTFTTDRARLAVLTRHRGPNDPAVIEARRDYQVSRVVDHLEREAAVAPSLTREQHARIVAACARFKSASTTPGSASGFQPQAQVAPVENERSNGHGIS